MPCELADRNSTIYAALTEIVAGAPVGVAVFDVPPYARTVQVLAVVVEAAKYQV